MITSVCVYSSSSDAVDLEYFRAAAEMGALIGARGMELVYGGANVGLMGTLARAAKDAGGRVTGVIPRTFSARGLAFEAADELVLTDTLRERKAVMEERAGAFVALPGGFGTLEETLEAITLKQLGSHDKPVVFVNTSGFYDRLIDLFERLYALCFAKGESRSLYHLAPDPEGAMAYIDGYSPVALPEKWF
ncbi:MAG TPA: TIGR00730 family Rossman fold protein [Spirochaetota bacterium]|nr:TIGR00730 family Rossman fold protein [Spirochaetota bacterium]